MKNFTHFTYRCPSTYDGWGYIHINPFKVENTVKSKTHLIHLTYQTSYFAQPILHLLRTQYLKTVATQYTAEYQLFRDLIPDWELWLMAVAQLPESILPQVISLGKNQNSKFKLQFLLTVYHFHTIARSKNCKLNNVSYVGDLLC